MSHMRNPSRNPEQAQLHRSVSTMDGVGFAFAFGGDDIHDIHDSTTKTVPYVNTLPKQPDGKDQKEIDVLIGRQARVQDLREMVS